MPLLDNIATQGAGAIMGMMLGGYNDRRQREQQQDLQNLQIRGQKEMTDYNYKKQMEMWNATNYGAQIKHLKAAGLNPGLIYGMGGAGGATAGTGGGAGPTGGQAPTGGGEIQQMVGMAMQNQMMRAQLENIEAQTEKTKAETANVPLTGENIQAQTGLTSIQTKLAKISAEVQGATIEEAIQKITAEAGIMQEVNVQSGVKTQVDRATQQAQILTTQAGLVKALLDNKQVQAQTGLTTAQTGALSQTIAQGWEKLRQSGRQLTYEEWGKAIQQQVADFQTTHPNIEQIKGGLLDELIKGFRKIANIQ